MNRDRSRLGAAIFLAVPAILMIGIGLFLLIRGADSTVLRCERANDLCTLTSGNRLGRTTQRIAISEIQQAVVKREVNRTYRVEIQRTNGLVAAHIDANSARNELEHRKIADAFNRFLRDQQTPTYVFSQAAQSVFAGGVFTIGFGALFGALSYWQFWTWQEGE